jgi:ribosome-binding protein aMBF1 (putative translation factor)
MTTITPQQCRAARAWLDLRQDQLAEMANVGLSTLRDFESEKRKPIPNNVEALRRALESVGVEFIEEKGRKGVAVKDDARSKATAKPKPSARKAAGKR